MLTEKARARTTWSWIVALVSMHTSSIGGSSERAVTALAVIPSERPASSFTATTVMPATRCAIVARKRSGGMLTLSSGDQCHEVTRREQCADRHGVARGPDPQVGYIRARGQAVGETPHQQRPRGGEADDPLQRPLAEELAAPRASVRRECRLRRLATTERLVQRAGGQRSATQRREDSLAREGIVEIRGVTHQERARSDHGASAPRERPRDHHFTHDARA